ATVGSPVSLDAGKSRDRDGNGLQFAWFFYAEAGSGMPNPGGGRRGGGQGGAAPAATPGSCAGRATGVPSAPPGGRGVATPRVTVANANTGVATETPNSPGTAHVILAVTDNGTPALTSYRRVILTIR